MTRIELTVNVNITLNLDLMSLSQSRKFSFISTSNCCAFRYVTSYISITSINLVINYYLINIAYNLHAGMSIGSVQRISGQSYLGYKLIESGLIELEFYQIACIM